MADYYRSCSVPVKPEMEKADIVIEDEDVGCFELPSIYYDGCSFAYDEEFMFDWADDSILVKRAEHIIKYSQITGYDVLIKDEDGEPTWYKGPTAELCGATKEEVIDFRQMKDYWIEDYDLEKSVKRRYKVILEETSEMDEFDHLYLER